ncbi:protein FAM89A-like isoform X2 [Centruroides sculpturatus]|uniref:protein FAM89A-like isoform X2 n=1 Tax=Centruroides sculpturatus TaxID=218467 RepID=UPI000C6CBA51|nr:protein FAM89A-like isoform X2 [Centruroides sculpturatus]
MLCVHNSKVLFLLMASLQGLPPLPKSLSGLLNFSSAQWKELERLYTMRTMIQQDLTRNMVERSTLQHGSSEDDDRSDVYGSGRGSPSIDGRGVSRASRLDAQLALLRKEMVGLRQLDMSLLCQLWSLNESIQEYKQLLQERMSFSPTHASSPGWDNGLESPSSEEPLEVNGKQFKLDYPIAKHRSMHGHQDLDVVPERLSSTDSSSHSSLEFGGK